MGPRGTVRASMKLATFACGDGPELGIVAGRRVIPISRASPGLADWVVTIMHGRGT